MKYINILKKYIQKIFNYIKKIKKYIISVLVGIIVFFCVYALFCTVILRQKYINVGGYTFFVVASGSMSGTINVNDMVIVKITDEFETNDIITYMQENHFITHRVISTKNDRIITKGDINNTEDEPITLDDVIGKVVFVFSFTTIFKVLGSLILIAIIIIVFNFDKICKKYIFVKNLPKGVSFKNTKLLMKFTRKKYNPLVTETINMMKQKCGNKDKELMDPEWVKRLKYVTKYMELIKQGEYTVLKGLVNSYKIPDIDKYIETLPLSFSHRMMKESYDTHIVLLLNSVMYNDNYMFIAIHICLMLKINEGQKK